MTGGAMTNRAWIAAVLVLAGPAAAQWPARLRPGTPRTPDGKPNLAAPAPRTADGKPDLAGVWQPAPGYVSNIALKLKPEEVPFQPWAAELFKHRRDTESREDPTGWCIPGGVPRSDAVPYPFKVVNAGDMVLILYEAVHSFRQIFLDGRAFPKDPNPTWLGYSIGHWVDDGLLVESRGFNDKGWLDNDGRPATEALRVTEHFRRKDFGHMDVEIVIDDAKAYTKPWTVTLPLTLLPEGELIEYICDENNKDVGHLVGK